MFNIKDFIKKFLILDVIWGRRSKMLAGLKDGGAEAARIGDPNIAKLHNGNTIFNVNHPDNICTGGHFHSAIDNTEVCINFLSTDWKDGQIEVIQTGTPTVPGQIGPHSLPSPCLQAQVYQKVTGAVGDFKLVGVHIIINSTTKSVFLIKTGLSPNFEGKIILDSI